MSVGTVHCFDRNTGIRWRTGHNDTPILDFRSSLAVVPSWAEAVR